MIEKFSSLEKMVSSGVIESCFVDTSAIFSATYPLDLFNESCERLFNALAESGIPLFLNVNVRAEFLENHRRVLIAESLIDFLEDFENRIDGALAEKLKAHRTSYRRKVAEEKSYKIELQQIKRIRSLLSSYSTEAGKNGWDVFCKNYLKGKIESIWQDASTFFNLTIISLRGGNSSPYLNQAPEWAETMRLMGDYGLPSSDAMILNMFLCSKISAFITSDLELAEVTDLESKGRKSTFVPDTLIT